MLKYGKNNVFTFKKSGRNIPILIGISRILEFYDFEGDNIIYLHSGDNSFITVHTNKIKYDDIEELPGLILSNLFRVTLIVINPSSDLVSIKNIRDITDIPIIIIQRDHSNISRFTKIDQVYRFSMSGNELLIRSVTDGWESNLDSIEKILIRKDKINNILGPE